MVNENKRGFPAYVVEIIDEFKIVINRGTEDGIKKGDNFLVYCLGQELKDPETGESLGELEIVRGKATAVHVQRRMATIESSRKRKEATRRIIKDSNPLRQSFLGSSETIEETPLEKAPFEDSPSKNDLVKKI